MSVSGDISSLRWCQTQPSISYDVDKRTFSSATPGGVCVTLCSEESRFTHYYPSWTMVMMSPSDGSDTCLRWVPAARLRAKRSAITDEPQET